MHAFGKVSLGGVADRDGIVSRIPGDGVGELAVRVDITVKDVHDGIARFLAEVTAVDDSGYIIVLDTLINNARSLVLMTTMVLLQLSATELTRSSWSWLESSLRSPPSPDHELRNTRQTSESAA
jgi:hypothetical protein